jgi:hypothetical protein
VVERRPDGAAAVAVVSTWWKSWRLRLRCMHHDPMTGQTFVRFWGILDHARKCHECTRCGKTFYQ